MRTPFDLDLSIEKAEKRLLKPRRVRKKRSDIGSLRIDKMVVALLDGLLAGQEYPGIQSLCDELARQCAPQGKRCPSRSSIYKLLRQAPDRSYPIEDLPDAARNALYNLASPGRVPGAQLVYYCLHYGSLAAIHFAAGLPWLSLFQAQTLRGWRPRSLGLLRAVLLSRGIPLA